MESEVCCAFCAQELLEEEALKIRAHFLCRYCEAKLIATSVQDEGYPIYVKKIKEFWADEPS